MKMTMASLKELVAVTLGHNIEKIMSEYVTDINFQTPFETPISPFGMAKHTLSYENGEIISGILFTGLPQELVFKVANNISRSIVFNVNKDMMSLTDDKYLIFNVLCEVISTRDCQE